MPINTFVTATFKCDTSNNNVRHSGAITVMGDTLDDCISQAKERGWGITKSDKVYCKLCNTHIQKRIAMGA